MPNANIQQEKTNEAEGSEKKNVGENEESESESIKLFVGLDFKAEMKLGEKESRHTIEWNVT